MNIKLFARDVREPEDASSVPVAEISASAGPPPWEMIEAGRYMPRRIRGSYLGRELG